MGPAVAVGSEGDASDRLRRLVAEHQPVDDRERHSKERFLAEIDRLASPCDQEADPVHVTASALVVGRRGMVLHLHRRLGRWMQPGGHVEPFESPPEAALRESEEETGLRAVHPAAGPLLVHLDVHPASSGHTHLDLRYLLGGTDADPAPPKGESPEVRWCTWEEVTALADDALIGAVGVARSLWEGEPQWSSGGARPPGHATGDWRTHQPRGDHER